MTDSNNSSNGAPSEDWFADRIMSLRAEKGVPTDIACTAVMAAVLASVDCELAGIKEAIRGLGV